MAVVLLTVLWTARAAIIIQPWSPIFQGVEFATGTADDTEVRLQQVQALRVDLADPNVEFFSTPSNGDAPMETFGQTTTTFVQTYGLAVGVNANFFSPVNTTPNDPRELSGLAISRGDIVSPFESGRPAVLITRSNTVSFATSAPASYTNVWAAVAGSDRVLINGVAQLATCETSFCGPNPRTAVGLSQNGRYFYLVTIDGRRPGWSDGATLYETGLWMQRLGACNALNLDGGGSTAMAKLTNGTAVLLNRPSGGVQRVNGNHIGVFAPPLSPVITAHPTNATVSLDSPATFYVVAMGAPTLRYQWRFNGNPIPGATASSHTVAIAQLTNAGNYSVMVTNGYGTALSSNAALTVLPPVTAILGAGDDSLGQLNIPAGSTNLLAIAAGAWHSLALRRDGRVLAWGNDWDGQATVPPALSNAVAIAAGGYHSLALGADCRVVAWGADGYGQATVPGSLSKVLAIAAGTWHSLVLTLDGRVVAWGDNAAGQTNAPAGLSYAVAIAGGGNHSLAVRADGTVAAWGDNTDAQGNHAGQASVPLGLSNVVGIAAGSWHSLALKADGCVMAWGDNSLGQCNVPAGLSNVVFVAGGGSHSLALRRDGVVFAWGNNWNGQCSLPVGAANAAAIAAGGYHTLALRDEGLKVASIFQTRRQGTDFAVLVSTLARRHYALEGLDVLGATNWIALPTASGNGAVLRLSDPDASDAHRFYRVRQW
jgi:hypothetical protein